jgi:uncharacterized protein YjdB
MTKFLRCFPLIVLAVLAGCGGGSITTNSGGGSHPAVVLQSIRVSMNNPSLPAGATGQLTATGSYSDGSSQDLTSSATWSSSNPSVATVNSSGLATGKSNGSATITAASGAVTGTAPITVTVALVSISVSPAVRTIAISTDQQFKATGTFSDGSTQDVTGTVTWGSAKSTIATVSNIVPTKGLAQALAAGSSIITASSGSISGTATLTVSSSPLTSIVVTPANSTVPIGLIQQSTAIGTFADGTTQDITNTVAWSSSPSNIASITVSGAASALKSGTATITATSGPVTGNTQLTVNAANVLSITIQQGNVTIAQGTSTKLNAVGLFNDGSTRDVSNQVTWSSSNPSFATIQSNGKAHGVSPGLSTITATLGVQSASVSLNVTNATIVSISVAPSITSIAPGTQLTFAATGSFSDSSTQTITGDVAWASSDTTVATIGNNGGKSIAAAIAPGSVTVSATLGTATGTAQLTVNSVTLTSIALTPTSTIVAPASTLQWTAIGTFSDLSTQNVGTAATWTSSSPSTASVTSYGLVTGQSAGIATITASLQGISSTANVVVESATLSSISVFPSSPTVPQAISKSLTAIGTFGNGTGNTQDLTSAVTWTSSSAGVATISNAAGTKGEATGVAPGSSTISAVFAGQVGTTALQVTNTTLTSLAILPNSASITLGSQQSFAVKGSFSDGSIIDLSSQVAWTSSNVNVAVINAQGLASSVSSGTTTITASLNGVNTTTVLTVQ